MQNSELKWLAKGTVPWVVQILPRGRILSPSVLTKRAGGLALKADLLFWQVHCWQEQAFLFSGVAGAFESFARIVALVSEI
jgi:hypothetical protein